MSTSNYYEKVSDLHIKLDALITSLNEVQKIISPSLKDRKIFPGLIDTTPKSKQLELLKNAWIILELLDTDNEFNLDINELIESLEEVGNCPVEPESEFQGYAVGQ